MLKLRSGLVVLLLVGVLCCTPLLQGGTGLDAVDEEQNPFSPVFYERFYNCSLDTALTCLDVENDGDLDYVYGPTIYVFLCMNKGIFERSESIFEMDHNQYYDNVQNGGLSTADMNNDGLTDIIVGGVWGKLRILQNEGKGNFVKIDIWEFEREVYAVDTVDWDNDGLTDIVVGNMYDFHSRLSKVYLISNLDDGRYSSPIELFTYNTSRFRDLSVQDFDNDGDWDVVVSHSISVSGYNAYGVVALVTNNGDGGYNSTILSLYGDGEFPDCNTRIHPYVATADYNQDGNIDIAFGDRSGMIDILWNVGGGLFQESQFICDLGNTSMPIASDYDMDGDIDLVVSTEGYHLGVDGGFYVIYNNINPMSLQTPQPNHLYVFDNQLDFGDSSLLIGPTTFRINRQVDTDYVEFYVNDKLMHTDSSYPFEWRWSKLHFGEANVKIIGYFADGTTYTLQNQYMKFF